MIYRCVKPSTPLDILSVIDLIYDPLEFLALVMPSTKLKLLLHDLCHQKLNWDDQVSKDNEVF